MALYNEKFRYNTTPPPLYLSCYIKKILALGKKHTPQLLILKVKWSVPLLVLLFNPNH